MLFRGTRVFNLYQFILVIVKKNPGMIVATFFHEAIDIQKF